MKFRVAFVVVGFFSLILPMVAQTASNSAGSSAAAQIPSLVNFNGVLADVNGKPLTGVIGVTFSLYKEQQGGSPLWLETQNVHAGKTGNYTVALGSSSSQGLPASVFAAGRSPLAWGAAGGTGRTTASHADERALRFESGGCRDSRGASGIRLPGSDRRSEFDASG